MVDYDPGRTVERRRFSNFMLFSSKIGEQGKENIFLDWSYLHVVFYLLSRLYIMVYYLYFPSSLANQITFCLLFFFLISLIKPNKGTYLFFLSPPLPSLLLNQIL